MLSRRARKFLREKSLCEPRHRFAYRTRPFAFRMNESHVPFPSKFGGGLAASSRNSHIGCCPVCNCCVGWVLGVGAEGLANAPLNTAIPQKQFSRLLAEETVPLDVFLQ